MTVQPVTIVQKNSRQPKGVAAFLLETNKAAPIFGAIKEGGCL